MAVVAASPTPSFGNAVVPFSSIPDNRPPYEDMILRAILALKKRRGSTQQAISKYITEHYSELPPTHATLLTQHLRQLLSKDVIHMWKLCYKLTDGSKNLGRPPKATPSGEPKKRGRPPKLESDIAPVEKRKRGRPRNTTAPVVSGAVYILPQAQLLNSGFLQSFPGAAAIVLPKSLLSEKVANSPILILPNAIQSLVDASLGKRKRGRPKNIDIKKKRGRPRKKAVEGKPVNLVANEPGRSWKIRDLLMPENVQGTQETTGLESKKRSVGRPRKYPLLEGPNPPPAAISR